MAEPGTVKIVQIKKSYRRGDELPVRVEAISDIDSHWFGAGIDLYYALKPIERFTHVPMTYLMVIAEKQNANTVVARKFDADFECGYCGHFWQGIPVEEEGVFFCSRNCADKFRDERRCCHE